MFATEAGPQHTLDELYATLDRMSKQIDVATRAKEVKDKQRTAVAAYQKLQKMNAQHKTYYPDDKDLASRIKEVVTELLVLFDL